MNTMICPPAHTASHASSPSRRVVARCEKPASRPMNTTISVSTTSGECDPDQHLLGRDVEPAAVDLVVAVAVAVAVERRIDVVGHRVTALATAPNAEPAATSATKWLPVPITTAATATG